MPTIVILDDQVTNQKIYAKMAASIEDEVEVVTFGEPELATAWLERNVPSLIVTDYQMPGMNGAAFIRRLRGDPRLSDVPVIVITVFEERSFRLNALDAGATDFLQSPVDHREFVTRARNLLKLRRQQLLLADKAQKLERKLVRSERTLERAIRDSGERLAQVVDTVPAMVSATDAKGRILFANAFLARFVGCDPASLARRDLEEAFGEERGRREKALNRLVIEKGEAIGGLEEELVDPNGVRCWFLATKTPLRDPFDRVIGVVTSALDITDRKATEIHLHTIAHTDALTGLANRTALTARLRLEAARARRGERFFALHLLDLDGFKDVNDVLGHATGDVLLQKIAGRLRRFEQEGAVVARLGGDEFAVLQINLASQEAAADMAARICDAVADPVPLPNRPLETSASVGTAIYPVDGTDDEDLFRNADLAMYRAKASGGGQHRFYAADMKLRAEQAMRLDADLRSAIQNKEFVLFYQPQVDAETHRVVGVEALIRWRLPDGSMRTPVAFLQRAEENGMMLQINGFVLREACRQLAAWADVGLDDLRMSVNLSPIQFRSRDLPAEVARLIAETGIDPTRLDLELTETTVMEDHDAVAEQLQALRGLGVTISIDDFGTGFCSLSYVKRFPADRLKIDQSFVQEVTTNPQDAAIVKAILNLGHSLGMAVVAEGVETAEQAARLAQEGCDELQGYHFGKPMPARDFARQMISRGRGRAEAG